MPQDLTKAWLILNGIRIWQEWIKQTKEEAIAEFLYNIHLTIHQMQE